MSKSIEGLPKYRAEAGKATAGKKEREIIEEPPIEVNKEYSREVKRFESDEAFKERQRKEAAEYERQHRQPPMPIWKMMGYKEEPRLPAMTRLFGAAQGMARKIGDYFAETRRWMEFQFAKKELAKGKPRENIFESIEQNEDPIDLTAFRKVLEGTSEAVDLDVSEFEERSENGLANLEEKAEEAEVGNEIPESTRKFMEALEREAEEAKEEFKEEMSDEEYEERTREAKELLGEEYKIPSPKELEEKISERKKEEFAKKGYEIPSPEELRKRQKEKEVKMDLFSAEEQLRIIKDQLENLKERGIKWKEITELEERQRELEQELREFKDGFGEAFKPEKAGKREEKFGEGSKKDERERGEAPFGEKVIDESHKRYLEIKKYEEEHGMAPKGESADMYLSFSFKDYQNALDKNPKKASKMEEEMYEKLAMGAVRSKSQKRRETAGGKVKTSIRGEI